MAAVDPGRFASSSSKARVLEAALFLFSERGYFNTSVHHVARYAGTSIGASYRHFHDKAGIAQALYDSLLQPMLAELEALHSADASAEGQIRAIVALFFKLTERDPATMQFMLDAQHRDVAANCLFGGPVRMITAHLNGALEPPLSAYRDQMCQCSWRAVCR